MVHQSSHRERGTVGPTVRTHASLGVAQAAGYVEVLAQALRAGGVTVRSGGDLVALRAGERTELELEAGEEGRHSVVRLELRWETPVPEQRLEIVPGMGPPGAFEASVEMGADRGPTTPPGAGTVAGRG